MKSFTKRLFDDEGFPLCTVCGTRMVNAIDPITRKVSKYLWKTKCGHLKSITLSVG